MYAPEHARDTPDRAALIMASTGEVVSYAEFEHRANRAAHLLRESELTRQDHVAFIFGNDPALLECEAGAERAGLVYTPVNNHLSSEQIEYIINDSHAQVVVLSRSMLDVVRTLPGRCPKVRRWLVAGDDSPPESFESYDRAVSDYPTQPVPEERLGGAMLYSAGTTGRPKGIYRRLPDVHPSAPSARIAFTAKLFGMRPGMVYLSPAPLYHSAPQSGIATALRLGGTSVIMDRFEAARFLALIERYAVTHTQVVPTMFSRLLALPEEIRTTADTSSLEYVVHAAAPCPIPVKEAMINWLGPIIGEYYSATEANGATACNSAEWLAHRGTVGKALLGEVHILDDSGQPCPPGTIGTIWFRGATNFVYFNDQEQTASSRNDSGDMSTVGDVGYLDADGYLYLTDRKSLMIISGGVNIYPQETENVLAVHGAVADAAVIGVPNEDLGEEVKAVVMVAPGVVPSEELGRELIEYCRARISHIACPRSVDFVDELPRTPTGKLAKRLLRQAYWPDPAPIT